MKKPTCSWSIFAIIFCTIFLLISAFLNFGGFGPSLRLGLAVAMTLMPIGDELKVWIEQPIPAGAAVKLSLAESLAPEGVFSGSGKMEFNLTMFQWDNEVEPTEDRPERLTQMVMIQEEAEIDTIQRYKVILTKVTLNYWNFVNWILVIAAGIGLNTGLVMKLMNKPPPE